MISFAPPLVLPLDIEKPRFLSRLSITTATHGNLPHWQQDGVTVFVTFRLADSLPQDKLGKLRTERQEWLRLRSQTQNGCDLCEYDEVFSKKVEDWLDAGHGECILRDRDNRHIVEDSLLFGNGKVYRLYAFVVMPNHVHVVFMPFGDARVADIIQKWKSISSRKLNRRMQRNGRVWMPEYFDRCIRNGEHFERAVRYTLRNDNKLAWSVFDEEVRRLE